VAGVPVDSITDLEAGTRQWADGRVEQLNLPKSDVLTFWLKGGARIIVRPSGTEPKIKCYYEIVEPVAGDYEDAKSNARNTLETLIESHQKELGALAN
jgi:phosphomannomutase